MLRAYLSMKLGRHGVAEIRIGLTHTIINLILPEALG